jgi:hypothetical protein
MAFLNSRSMIRSARTAAYAKVEKPSVDGTVDEDVVSAESGKIGNFRVYSHWMY